MKETTDPSGAGECEDNNQQKLKGKTIGKEIETMEGAGLLSLSLDPVRLLESSSRVWRDGWMDGFAVFRLVYDDSIDSMR